MRGFPATTYQLRAWQRRAATLERNAAALMGDMMKVVGVEYELAGENFTSQADDVAESAANLVGYLETCIRLTRDARGGRSQHDTADRSAMPRDDK